MTLTPGLLAALERFVAHERVLVALDFDGTLAPEVDDPAHARALPDALDALARLHTMPGVTLALISGRSLASLAAVSELPADVPLVGSHGLELRWMAGDAVPAINDLDHQHVAALHARLAPLVGQVDGAWIERKPAGLAVHTRLVESTAATALQRTVRDAARAFDGNLTVRDGANVVEFSVRDATKGDGVRALRTRFSPQGVLVVGDDVTDEDAFAALGPDDVGIKVGAAATIAEYRVADPAAVADVLLQLAALRLSLKNPQ